MLKKHHYYALLKRGSLCLLFVAAITLLGAVGIHKIEKYSWVDSFYFVSMIVTAQGANITPATAEGKIFTAVISFISVGCVVAALGYVFGPFLGALWRMGSEKIEEEIHHKK